MISKKKIFPQGTFIPTPLRVLAILQLCLAFFALCWNGGIPFMGELFSYKSSALLYQDIMGDNTLLKKLDPAKAENLAPRLERNASRFASLPKEKQEEIKTSYDKLQILISRSFMDKFKRSLSVILIEISPYELAWIFFSVVISILLLLRIEGAAKASIILPLLVLFFAIDNQLFGKNGSQSHEMALFPTEETVLKESNEEKNRYDALKDGWRKYLVKEWAKDVPSTDSTGFEMQVEKGEFLFNLARIDAIQKDGLDPYQSLQEKKSLWTFSLYFLWNSLFVFFFNKIKTKEDRRPSPQNSLTTPEGLSV